jgi:hypothetical protein
VITYTVSGSFKNTEKFLKNALKINILNIMESYGHEGVRALSAATPLDSGIAAHSWGFFTLKKNSVYYIFWTNSDIENGFPVVVMLQYGHGTGTGGYIPGIDFINPAIKPIFDKITDAVWKAVTSG